MEEDRSFENVKSFGKYNFYLPEDVKENDIIIVPKGTELGYDEKYNNKVTINQFDIYEY